MFVVNQDTTQYLQINLSDEYSSPNFLFVLSGNGLTEQKLFFATADSSKSPRVLEFTIEENATEDLMDGIISLPNASDLYCSLYNPDTKTLSIPDSSPIWRGLFRVKNETTTINENEVGRKYYEYDPR